MMQAVKTSHEKEIQAFMEAQARLELEIAKRDSPAITQEQVQMLEMQINKKHAQEMMVLNDEIERLAQVAQHYQNQIQIKDTFAE